MSTVGDRVREERKRLELTQTELAQACGKTPRTVKAAEANENWPGGDVLAGMHRVGMDVVYILSGERNATLPPVELTLLTAWRVAEPQVQQMVMAMLGGIGLPAMPPAAPLQIQGGQIKAKRIGQANSGPVTQNHAAVSVSGGKSKKARG